ncbi:MAG: long-chain fatty acid--CoA ligase [Prolixibacteraceae bacterium]|nr:long-chain fatty acid--CoA ligase [Prolixibacteraceae bacterium]
MENLLRTIVMEMANHEVKRNFDLLKLYATRYAGKKNALGGKNMSGWYKYSAKEYIENTKYISLGFLSLGLEKGDKVATVSVNRPEWNFVDLGLAQAGLVHVPIYPTISINDYKYILQHCEAKYVVVGDKKLYDKIEPLVAKIESLKDIYTFEDIAGVKSWKELCEEGKKSNRQNQLDEIKESISEDDLATIIYTSGTTGLPKGVMLSHRNLVSNFTQHAQNHNLGEESTALSFLPLCHVYERSMNYHFQFKGMSIYYVGSLAQILPALKEVKPDMFNTVPRLLERIYDGIINKGKELKGAKKSIFFWAVKLGDKFDYGRNFSWWYRQKRKLADKLVYSKWRAVMGGNIKIIVSGGAALQPRIGKVLGVANIMTLEGYGLTETSPVIAVSNPAKNEIKIGTVGPVLPGVDLKLADDGEITCKGPNVMMGYFKDPERTKRVIDENGYFHTGDVGILVDNKYLKITDRKKEIFKLSGGKYIAPQMIENKLKESFFIEQAMVVGENEKFASAIVVPAFSYIRDWIKQKGTDNNITNDEILQMPEVIASIRKDVREINKSLGEFEVVKRYKLIADEWSPDTGEMSPTLKLKRNVLAERYNNLIDEIYASPKPQDPKAKTRRRIPRINLSLAELINKLRNGNSFF